MSATHPFVLSHTSSAAAQAAYQKYKMSIENKKALQKHYEQQERQKQQRVAAGGARSFILGGVLIAAVFAVFLFA